MDKYELVTIEPEGAHYLLWQSGRILFKIPRDVFESFEADTPYPPSWSSELHGSPVRYLLWNPQTFEFLMGDLPRRPPLMAESFGSSPFRAYLNGYWLGPEKLLLIKPHWYPSGVDDVFDDEARSDSFEAQIEFVDRLRSLRHPPGALTMLNVTDRFIGRMGIGNNPDSEKGFFQTELDPALNLDEPRNMEKLRGLAMRAPKHVCPIVIDYKLAGLRSMDSEGADTAEKLLREIFKPAG